MPLLGGLHDMFKKHIHIIALITLCVLSTACNNHKDSVERSNTIGAMTMAVDATVYPLIKQAAQIFKSDYPKAVIDIKRVPGQKAINDLMMDSVMVAITTRRLTEEEQKEFVGAYRYEPTMSKFAVTGIALVINNNNPNRLLTAKEVKNIFKGKIKKWNHLDDHQSALKDSIFIVFDSPYSSTIKAVMDFAEMSKFNLSNAAALQSNREVIQYVSEHPNALGVIGVNWISQKDDNQAQEFLSKIKVVAIAPVQKKDTTTKYYLPLQENLKAGLYPITKGVYIINRGESISLGTGFAAFLNSPRGQLLIEKSGLVPMRETPMIIYLKDDFTK